MAAAIAAISGSPIVDDSLENTVQYRQMNATAAAFLANVDYTENANDYSVTKVTPYYSATTAYSKEEPDGLKIKVPANTALTVAQGGKTRSDAVSGAGVIYNMEPLKAGTFAFGGKTYKIVPEGGVRMIYTPSVWNVRDLGGWACTGGRVKYGKIFRGGHFGSITDADKATIVDWLGVAVDIDLRNNGETGSITTSPLGTGVEYFHQSLDFYANAVNTSAASARTVAVLKKVMSCVASNKPCYFHCMSGADRTGTIAYLLLSLLGVSQSDKDKDYELTAFSDEADGKRFRNTNYNATNGNGWYPLIKYFRDTYTGENDNEKVVAWAVANGITTAEINAFRAAMISGNAGEVVVPPHEYTVTNALTGCTNSNSATTVNEGDAYYATITANTGYTMSGATIQVKMGGTVVTDLYYNNGVINIPEVSGNIEITITAAVYVPTYTNVLPTALNPDTKSGVWDGIGYRNGAYASSSKPFYGTDAAYWCTGAITVQPSDVIYVKGATLEGGGHARLSAMSSYNGNSYWCKEFNALSGMATVTKLGDKYYKIVLDSSQTNYSYIGYIMFSALGTGNGVVVTKNEEISEGSGGVVVPPQEYTVTTSLTGCVSGNAQTSVTEGDSYYAKITASSGYTMNGATVQIRMGGTNVTALYYADGIINIPNVSGNIEITITAVVYTPTYTNILSTALTPNTKSEVWDGKGYRNGAYASSASPFYGTDGACFCTGAIPYNGGDVIYVKGATLEGSGHSRLGALSQTGCFWCKEWASLAGMAIVTKLGDKYYKFELDSSHPNYASVKYIMFSAQGTGDGVIVTKNEEIT